MNRPHKVTKVTQTDWVERQDHKSQDIYMLLLDANLCE